MTVQDAIVACRVYDRQGLAIFQRQYDSLLRLLGEWSYAHREKLDKVFLTVRDAGLLSLLVTKRKTCDESFEDELTELDIQIANSDEFSQIELSAQALPLCGESNFESFCYPERTLEYKRANAK